MLKGETLRRDTFWGIDPDHPLAEAVDAHSDGAITWDDVHKFPALADFELSCCHQIGEHLPNCPGRLLTP